MSSSPAFTRLTNTGKPTVVNSPPRSSRNSAKMINKRSKEYARKTRRGTRKTRRDDGEVEADKLQATRNLKTMKLTNEQIAAETGLTVGEIAAL